MDDSFRWVLLALLVVLYGAVAIGVFVIDFRKPLITRRRREQLENDHDTMHANEFPSHHYRIMDPDRHPVDWAEEGWFASGQPR
jgi:hypothetical protein